MKRSWRICRVAGIGIDIHWTFLLLVVFIVWIHLAQGAGILGALRGLGFVAAIFVCIVFHELGHALAARRFGVQTRDITLLPIGGMARLERMPEKPGQELVIALAGPAVTAVIAALLFGLVLVQAGLGTLRAMRPETVAETPFLVKLMLVNVILLAFNLLPAFPMDGGRVLRALLHFRLDYARATEIAAAVGQFMAVVFAIVGVLGANLILIVIAVFVYLSARAEAHSATVRSLCEGVPVALAMERRFRTLAADATLADASDLLLDGSQRDFPVVEGDRIVGMLMREDLMRGLAEQGREASIEEVMRRDCPPVGERESLLETFERMQGGRCSTVPVVRGGRAVGIVTLENVGEWIMIKSLRAHPGRHRIDRSGVRP